MAASPRSVASPTALDRLADILRATVVVDETTLRLVLVAVAARGHILLEDVPGVGKTLLARTLASAMGGTFHRVQFTSDLLPADITGGNVFDPRIADFSFRPGPVFANVVLADEINRGTPRSQSSLLEAMGEGHVSVDGTTHSLPAPFLVIATQNPVEQFGTFPLPEAELDRFLVRLRLGRPDEDQTQEILRRQQHSAPPTAVEAVTGPDEVLAVQQAALAVEVSPAARTYIGALTLATRNHPAVGLPASPRAAVALMRTSQAMAMHAGRDHVLPDDVKAVAAAVLAHRLAVATDAEEVVSELLDSTPVPLQGVRARPTRRLPGLLVAAMVVYLVAANSLVVWLYAVTAMVLAVLPVGVLGPLLVGRAGALRVAGIGGEGFTAPLRQDRGRVFVGDRVVVRVQGNVDLERCELGPVRTEDGRVWPVTASSAGPGVLLLEGHAERRGALRLRSVDMVCTWPFGLLTVRRSLPLRAEVVAHPRYWVPDAGRARGDLLGEEEAQRRGHGEDFLGVREYRSGDSRQHVHWSATARMGRLMVVETAAPAATPARFTLRLQPGATPEAAALATSTAASLVAGCVAAGRPFRFVEAGAAGSMRRWEEVLPRLALAGPGSGAQADDGSTVVTAVGAEVVVTTPRGSVTTGDGTSLDGLRALIEGGT